ncbi:hypothetical protein ACFL5O_03400 [Myxococcota bacterium]
MRERRITRGDTDSGVINPLVASSAQLEVGAPIPVGSTSMLEGADGLFTVHGLGTPVVLERSLSTTNPIENVMSTVRRVSQQVRRWKNVVRRFSWAEGERS